MQPLLNTRNWILQNHRMTEVWRDLWRSPGLTPAPAGTPRARCSGPGPGSLWKSPRRGLYSLWTACASALSYSQHRSATWYSKGISCFPICTCCLLSCHWAPLKNGQWGFGSAPFSTSLQVFIWIDEIPLSLLFSRNVKLLCSTSGI